MKKTDFGYAIFLAAKASSFDDWTQDGAAEVANSSMSGTSRLAAA